MVPHYSKIDILSEGISEYDRNYHRSFSEFVKSPQVDRYELRIRLYIAGVPGSVLRS